MRRLLGIINTSVFITKVGGAPYLLTEQDSKAPSEEPLGYFVANLVYTGGGLEIGIYFPKICERVTSHMGIHQGRLSSLFGD